MEFNRFKLAISGALLLGLPLAFGSAAYAAKPVELRHANALTMKSFLSSNGMSVKELKSNVDFKKTLHIHIQEMYNGYPVWGADGAVHVPNGVNKSHTGLNALVTNSDTKMNGTFYSDLKADLNNTPSFVFAKEQAQKALQQAIHAYQKKVGGIPKVRNEQVNLMVYVDDSNKAHWAYQVKFDASALQPHHIYAKPIYIMDAVSLNVFKQWNDMKTDLEDTFAGGFGGNIKMGKLVYDGLTGDLGKLNIQRDAATNTCYWQNTDVKVDRCTDSDPFFGCHETTDFTVPCTATDPDHNNVYWTGDNDAVNDGYSPSNDALFNGAIIKDLYQQWYNVPVLVQPDGHTPMQLRMVVHLDMDNAYWDGSAMYFGDGEDIFYPLTSLGVAAHEISHGFTEQHSDLVYDDKSGGLNEAFSDMAAQAAEFFAYGKNSWQIGPEIFKQEGMALRYMDQPSKDCDGQKPGPGIRCSLDDASQYQEGIDVHFISGVFNRFFYTLATTDGWDVKKAFDVMVHANSHFYWTSNVGFTATACGVIAAANDLNYDVTAVRAAFDVVKINYGDC